MTIEPPGSQEGLLRQLVDQVPAFLWIIDRDLVVRRIEGGQPMLDTLGRDRLVGLPMEQVTRMGNPTPEDLERSMEMHRRALRGESIKYRATWGGITLESHIRPLRDDTGEIVGIIGVGLDVTEAAKAQEQQRVLEAQLRQAQKMEALGQLAGGVAHDFNNILAAITGYAQLLRQDLPNGSSARDDASEILRAAERAASITRQLLAFSRRQVLSVERLNLVAVVRDMGRMLRALIPATIRIDVEPSGEAAPIPVVANRAQLEQVVMNLALNARDAMPNGGTLTIAVSVGATDGATLEVRDDGIGMSADLQARVFEPFFTTKDASRGTGLGLATVYGIVRQYDGSVSLASAEGAGTAVTVRLPLAPHEGEAAPAVASVAERPESQASRRILVVEDEDQVRDVTARVLGRAGYHVIAAPDAESALRVLRKSGAVDLVLTDAALPGMHGEELAAEIARTYPGTPIVLMSGFAELADGPPGQAGSRAIAAFVQKPFDVADLLATIARALAGEAVAG